ncbi:MAG: thiamine biosynthesis protein ThiF [Eubacterium sp.]|nr:thiamine biosynthesis protein ThiF [Eubacterium sp.]
MIPTKEEMEQAFAMRHGEELQKKFAGTTVAVCGLGGLGSNISIALARAGIGKLILIDFDQVDVTNLHRQQYKAHQVGMYKTDAIQENLKEISPYVELEVRRVKVNEENVEELVGDADVVCEAFDKAEAKAMLVNAVLEKMPEKYLVSGSGMAGFDSPNRIRTKRVTKRFYLCGDGVSDVNESNGLFAARVMVCAAHQAHTILRIIAGEYDV